MGAIQKRDQRVIITIEKRRSRLARRAYQADFVVHTGNIPRYDDATLIRKRYQDTKARNETKVHVGCQY